ncbi:MAG: NlpC/P60 family protein [Cellulosilyticaceae bacterium]
MKKLIKYMIICVVLSIYIYPTYGVTSSKNLFPTTNGITGTVIAKNVNVRSYPNTTSKIVLKLNGGSVKIIGKNNGWYKVHTKGIDGWINSKYVSSKLEQHIPYVKAKGEEIVAYGMKFMGTPYVWGGNSLEKGVDCSGFTKEVFDAFGVDISRVSYMQANDGRDISKSSLMAGDLIFFDTEGENDGNISHVGIYMGNNQFIHSDSTRGIAISKLSNPYYTRNYVKSVRVLG